MSIFIRAVWIFSTLIGAISIVWYLLGSTASFQRGLDLISSAIFIVLWVPALILIIFSTFLIIKGWKPKNKESYISFWILISFILILTISLFRGVNTSGWLYDRITSDPLRLTSDGKYEYRIDLINLFQKNSKERLYVRQVATGEESFIPLHLDSEERHGIGIPSGNDWSWAILRPTDYPYIYDLITTENLSVDIKRFEINLEVGAIKEIN
ncbi:hypothetical protein [Paenibacillus alvei]|uniref:hypothetical protein n=1 Tax=Paenibacillus alvei TaxID=44250 RepID=UPI000385B4B3|nr:hypothetical protein [Paenibacillus alvei]EPY12122.1 hypothetical protein PAAL66ix_14531 [Paenibacillus alvei A6-6i-x]